MEDVGLEDPDPQAVNEANVRANESSRVPKTVLDHWLSKIPSLDGDQRVIFEDILRCASNTKEKNRLFYVDARAGCGKTFVCNCISAQLRSIGKMVLTSAPSALAASLHLAGTTCHKCFGLPVTNDRVRRTSSLTTRSYQGSAIRLSDVLIIDEFSMLDVLNLDCIDRVCRDLTGNDLPFGGKVLFCCGEFAQLPPVVPNGLRRDIILASTVSHPLWQSFRQHILHTRWRNVDDIPFQTFCDGLSPQHADGFFESDRFLPQFRTCTTTQTAVDMFIDNFVGFPEKVIDDHDFSKLSLCPIYRGVAAAYHHIYAMALDSEISCKVRRRLSEEEICCIAVDTATKGAMITPEFIEIIASKNHQLPPGNLRLFRGLKVRLLRNFHPSRGLCNGTILIVRKVGRHHIEAQILSDNEFNGNIETLFRFKFDVESKALSFSRVQFPVASAFAGTVHRFQGLSVPEGSYLLLDQRKNPFCHGQGYVAMSRARRSEQVIVITMPGAEVMQCLTYKELCSRGFAISPSSGPVDETSDMDFEGFVAPLDDEVSVSSGPFNGLRPPPTDQIDEIDPDFDFDVI